MRMNNGEDAENKEELIDDDDDEELFPDDGELSSRMAVCRVNNGVPLSPRARMEQEKRVRREIANSNERRRMQSINAGFQTLKALLPRRDGEKMSKASILQQTSELISQLQQEKQQLMQKIAQYKTLVEASGLKPPVLQDNAWCGGGQTPQVTRNTIINDDINGPNVVVQQINDNNNIVVFPNNTAPPKKRRRYENHCSDSSDEGVGMMSDLEPKFSTSSSHNNNFATVMVQTDDEPQTAVIALPPAESSIAQDKLWEIEMLNRQIIEMRLALDRERRERERMRLLFENQLRSAEISNRLQTLSRLSNVSLLEYPTNFHAAMSPLFSTVGTSTFSGSSSLLVPPSDATSNINNCPSAAASVRLCSSPSPPATLLSPPLGAQPSTIPKYPPTPAPTPYSVFNTAVHSNSSRQSLEAIVEAIRHLEGDQLFVDVDCKPNSIIINNSSNNNNLLLNNNNNNSGSSNATPFHRCYQQNDSGISSPVSSSYHLTANPSDGATAVELQTFLQQQTSSNNSNNNLQ